MTETLYIKWPKTIDESFRRAYAETTGEGIAGPAEDRTHYETGSSRAILRHYDELLKVFPEIRMSRTPTITGRDTPGGIE